MDQDLLPGFAARRVQTRIGPFFARVCGQGPALVLLHGFPQTHACWHRIAPALAAKFTIVAMDLRGYGASPAPQGDGRTTYSKRSMALDVIEVMEYLGHQRFAIVGHDRGARVGYRLALDHPDRVTALAVLDIVPTTIFWQQIGAGSFQSPHWSFLARPFPQPEHEIGKNPQAYFDGLLKRWVGSGSLASFNPTALAAYRTSWLEAVRIHAFCEDYRAGATSDLEADDADLRNGRIVSCPTLLISGDYLTRGSTDTIEPAAAVWRRTFAPHLREASVRCGHFLAEENPEATLEVLNKFLTDHLAELEISP